MHRTAPICESRMGDDGAARGELLSTGRDSDVIALTYRTRILYCRTVMFSDRIQGYALALEQLLWRLKGAYTTQERPG